MNLLTLGILWFKKPDRPEKRPPPPEHVAGFFKDELGWNEEQSLKFEDSRKRYFNESKVLMDSIGILRKELYEEIFSDNSGERSNEITDKISSIQKRIDMQRFEHFSEIEKICSTEEQKDKLKDILMDVFLPMPTPENRMRKPPGPPPGGK